MKYGDYDNVTKDSRVLREILSRQGSTLLLEVLADSIGETALKYKFTASDRAMTKIAMLDELRELINERI